MVTQPRSTLTSALLAALTLCCRAAAGSASPSGSGVRAVPSAGSSWCPRYHLVNAGPSGDVYDPSGPIKVGDTWYVFADGGSSHWESSDLLRWKEVRPGWFSGLTGAITRTPAGFFAIYVDGGMVRKTAHGSNLSDWSAAVPINHSGVAGGMDPAQAFLLEGSWRLPVLSGDGRLSLMRATDDRLGSWDSAAVVLNESEFSHRLVTALPSDADHGNAAASRPSGGIRRSRGRT